mmetsp:Transcript_10716/g.15117  ORF Transcript_10716/g.15117 Transcript_10716/m.15117 type:complete len:93 (+) Transcript_10716:3-281(+)
MRLALPHVYAQLTPEACLGAYVTMDLVLRNYAAYDTFFHNDSVMQLAQAGEYIGPVAIEEYVKFASVDNPAILTREDLNFTFTSGSRQSCKP